MLKNKERLRHLENNLQNVHSQIISARNPQMSSLLER